MSANQRYEDVRGLPVVVTDPAVPASGDPVRYGNMTGTALLNEGDGGVALATQTVVDFGVAVYDHPVQDTVGGGIAVGDVLYYVDAVGLCNNSAGYPFGIALEVVGAGLTATIKVLQIPNLLIALGAGTVGDVNLAAGAVSVTKIANAILTALKVATVPDANTTGGIPILFRINVAGGAAGNTDVVMDHKIRVLDAWAVHTGGAGEAGDTIQLLSVAGGAITDAMSWSGADTEIVRAGSINDANHEVAAGDSLRVTTTDSDAGADVGAGIVYVLAIRVA